MPTISDPLRLENPVGNQRELRLLHRLTVGLERVFESWSTWLYLQGSRQWNSFT